MPLDVGTDEEGPATPSPAWPWPASEPLQQTVPQRPESSAGGRGRSGAGAGSSGDWSSAIALPATHGRRRRARVSSALAKTCMPSRITPTGSGSLLQLFLLYLVPQTSKMLPLAEPHQRLVL